MTSAGGQSRRLELFLFPKVFGRHRPARCCLSCQLAHPSPGALRRAPCTRGTPEDQAEHGLCFALRIHQGRGSAAGPPRGRDRMTQDRGRSYSYGSWCLCTGQGRAERNPRFGACAAQGRAHLQTPVRRHWDEDILLYCLPPD